MTLARVAVAIAGIICVLTSAEARERRYDRDEAPRYAVAESRFGHGTVSGPVRFTSVGPEVRLPGGSWIACRRSCSETLRVESVDFWENQGRDSIDNQCGLLGCLSIHRRF